MALSALKNLSDPHTFIKEEDVATEELRTTRRLGSGQKLERNSDAKKQRKSLSRLLPLLSNKQKRGERDGRYARKKNGAFFSPSKPDKEEIPRRKR